MICSTPYKSIVHDYIDGVLTGEIVAGKLVIAACRRHLLDLEKQNTDDFPYYFDEQEAEIMCRFFPLTLKHSKGKWAGLPFELSPWQLFIIWTLFGWKRSCDGTRRYRKALVELGRKNGKSTLAAGIALIGLVFDGEQGAEVYISATKREQAGCVFTECERMRKSSNDLKAITTSRVNNIQMLSTNSYIRTTSSDRPLDGPNPHFVVFDELHAWREVHRKFFDTMTTGGASRTQPLLLIITTAGDEQSKIWLEQYTYCRSVVYGEFVDDSMFVYIAEIDDDDDPMDESCWAKANPAIDVSVSMEYLREQAQQAKKIPSAYSAFVSKHCNKITTSTDKAFDIRLWDICKGELSDWTKADGIGCGIDLGGRDDLAAYAFVAKFKIDETDEGKPVYRYEGFSRAYIARDSKRDLSVLPFSTWIHYGYLTACEHPIKSLYEDMLSDCKQHYPDRIASDPANAQQLLESIQAEGFQIFTMGQTYAMFHEPIADLQNCIREHKFIHDGNPLLRWAVNNAVIIKDRQDRWMYDKRSSAEKIDPIVALTMAYRQAMFAQPRISGSLFIN